MEKNLTACYGEKNEIWDHCCPTKRTVGADDEDPRMSG